MQDPHVPPDTARLQRKAVLQGPPRLLLACALTTGASPGRFSQKHLQFEAPIGTEIGSQPTAVAAEDIQLGSHGRRGVLIARRRRRLGPST